MPLPSHHVAFTEYKGKIYAFGGFVLPQSGPAAWVPIDNAWEYDPARDTWRAVAPMPTKRGSPVAVTVGDRMYVIGGAVTGPKEAAVHPARAHYSTGAVEEYDPATNSWRPRAPLPTPRNHATAGVVNGKVYVIGGRAGGAFVRSGSSDPCGGAGDDPPAPPCGAPQTRPPSGLAARRPPVFSPRASTA